MGQVKPLPYIHAAREDNRFPLSRYLPPFYPGMASHILHRESPTPSLILDPVGSSPRSILELGREFRVLANCSNPILAFLITFLSKELTNSLFQAALAEISTLKRSEERLEEHLKSLYLTRCSKCRQDVHAHYFLYHRGETAPYARYVQCPGCGEEGLVPVTQEDLDNLKSLKRSYPMHRSRAFARASTGSEDNARLINEVLDLYPPRALYFIFTLLNRVEGLKLAPLQQEIMEALLLSVLDAGHSLNPWPETEESPRTLAQPEDYIERNLWQVMETAVEEWVNASKPVPLSCWPELPESSGISLHRGRMRDLPPTKDGLRPDVILSTIPRPYAAFWTLSAVWSTWLWGKESTAAYLGILERRRFDWSWHGTALQYAFAAVTKLLKPDSPVITLLPEPSTGLTNAVFNAASSSAWQLTGISCAGEWLPFQCTWKTGKPANLTAKTNSQRIIRDAIRTTLIDVGEPRAYTLLHAAAMAALAEQQCLPHTIEQLRGDNPNQISKEIQTIFADAKFLQHLGSGSSDLESGSWWLAQLQALPETVADQVECKFVEYLQQKKRVRFEEVMDTLSSLFSGFLSPTSEEISALLASYAKADPDSGEWILNDHDSVQKRAHDALAIQRLARETGKRLGYDVSGENPIDLVEKDAAGTIAYRLYVSCTARVGEFARLPMPQGCEYVFLFPGSRAALIKSKIDHNPLLTEMTAKDWHFLKFRTMRHLAVRADLSRELWALLIDSDPISLEETIQLSMFTL